MQLSERLPWQAAAWRQLLAREAQAVLPHALLFTGLPGVGKRHLARSFALTLLCEQREADVVPCLQCRACRLFLQGAHPDLSLVEPEEQGKQIGIGQVRSLTERLLLHSQYGRRIGIISPADSLTTAAANALLKTLEEPPAHVLLMLTASRPSQLPATIRSRCQQIALPVPDEQQARQWLRTQGAPAAEQALGLALGAPLRALELQASGAQEAWRNLLTTLEQLRTGRCGVVAAAGQWRGAGREVIPMLQAICADLARLAVGAEARYDDSNSLRSLAAGLDLQQLHEYMERLLEQRRYLEHALNEALVLESAFSGWLAVVTRA